MLSPRKFVNRRDKAYHNNRLNSVQQLDKVASYLLGLNYSGYASPTPKSQSLIQMDCVAVAVVNNEWLIASNTQRIGDDEIIRMANELGFDIVYALIKRGNGHMHAEMQILEELAASKYSSANVFIGVSKPCCKKCAEWIVHTGAKYTAHHDSDVVHWEKPDLS
ncbi:MULTISPECIES: nucleic acid/nucleotide deaminase domain-containing protein [unclassified Pseudomonas]|uniref:nucleic acid/nucleotide deaminase domain-containing protein n=1 Tax=unclassified Pseudomonas TaxID=196821 RepID=UPI000CD25F71|nr:MULTISPECIES: nucleic acid/nucleotide deaminase domain-containing protein [unclassified Pseudomonas]POA33920.1 hypothetical protein C1887_05635 [Pseudomonas sp. GW456-R21]POA65268.1 hypothetical protein C1884_18615 [Pseudomonas sp. GW460-R15]